MRGDTPPDRSGTPKTILHVGWHKTGTTLLQRNLFDRNEGALHAPRPELQRRFLRVGSLFFDEDAARSWLDDLRARAAQAQQVLVLSDEELSGHPHTGGGGGYVPLEICRRLHAVAPDAHVVMFVRNQVDLIESCYRQYVKEGGSEGIRGYLFNRGLPHRFPLFSFEHFCFDRLIETYDERFGADRVHVYVYEDLAADPAGFLRRFVRDLGLRDQPDLERLAHERVNPSYSAAGIRIARLMNRFSAHDPVNRKVLAHVPFVYRGGHRLLREVEATRLARWALQRGALMEPWMVERVRDFYGPSNRRLARRLGRDLGGLGYPLGERRASTRRPPLSLVAGGAAP